MVAGRYCTLHLWLASAQPAGAQYNTNTGCASSARASRRAASKQTGQENRPVGGPLREQSEFISEPRTSSAAQAVSSCEWKYMVASWWLIAHLWSQTVTPRPGMARAESMLFLQQQHVGWHQRPCAPHQHVRFL